MLSVIASGVYLEKTENTQESWTTVLGAATFLSESHPPWRLAASWAVISHGLMNISLGCQHARTLVLRQGL